MENIKYTRWDGTVITYPGTVPPDDIDDKRAFRFDDHLDVKNINNTVICTLTNKHQVSTDPIPLDTFIKEIECRGFDYIEIDCLADYIAALYLYRYESMLIHIFCLLQKMDDKKEVSDIMNLVLEQIHDIKVAVRASNAVLPRFNKEKLAEQLGKMRNNAQNLTDSNLRFEIEHALTTYENGGAFCHYRGVGRSIYPEKPGIFRNNLIHEEDRWYRIAKIHHQDEMNNRPYLDRLTMLQHFELPTRLLDVTTNPLVALYMAVNTIYTGDKEQNDIGELIVYFNNYGVNLDWKEKDGQKKCVSNPLEDYGSNPVTVYDGKSYDSSVVLMIASLVKLKQENKERMFRIITTMKKMIDEIAQNGEQRRALGQLVNYCVYSSAAHISPECHFTKDEQQQITDMFSSKLQSISKNKQLSTIIKPDDICRYLWKNTSKTVKKSDNNEENSEYRWLEKTREKLPYNNKVEFCKEYILFLSSYKYLLSTVRRANPAFIDHVSIFNLLKSYHVTSGLNNERIHAQHGSTIICGLDENYINDKMPCSRRPYSFRLLIKNKKEIARELNAIDINDSTMLPDMGHLASYLKSQMPK